MSSMASITLLLASVQTSARVLASLAVILPLGFFLVATGDVKKNDLTSASLPGASSLLHITCTALSTLSRLRRERVGDAGDASCIAEIPLTPCRVSLGIKPFCHSV